MKFAAIIEYIQNPTKIQEVRPIHRQYLATLKANGQLVVSGPFTDDSGALIVYEAASREEAEKLLQGDPFHQNGIFVSWLDVVLPLTLGSIWLACFIRQLRGRPLLPVHDPEFESALGRIIERGAPPRTAH